MNIFEAMEEIETAKVIEADTNIEIETPKFIEEMRQNPPFLSRTLASIEDVDEYGQNRGTMGLDFGFTHLNNAFNGLNPGLTLVAGPANSGKSALLLEMMRRVIKENQYQNDDHPKEAYCIYFSLDDSNNELMPRMIASDQMITINHVLFPKTLKDKPEIEAKRKEGFRRLKENALYFSMFDAENGQDIGQIESMIEHTYQELETVFPGRFQPVIFIDNFHDIDYQQDGGFTDENTKFNYISSRLNEIAIHYDAPVVCSAEFRKIDTLKRPKLDDIKSTDLKDRRDTVMCR